MLKTSLLATAATASGATVEAVQADAPATRIRLLPAGEMHLRDGRKFNLAAASMQAVIDLTKGFLGNADMMIDYDHQSERLAKSGGTAPAAAWIKTASLTAEPDGIYGAPEWTAPATAAMGRREYRYLSPTFFFDKVGNVLALKSAALVNIPAIDALAAVASTQETMMDLTAIAKALGLAETATIDEIVAAISAMKGDGVAMASTIAGAATALGLAATATLTEVATAATQAGKPDPAKFVPIEGFNEVNARLKALETSTVAAAATTAIDAATAAGKLPPAMRQWGLDLFAANKTAWDAFVASAATLSGGKLPGADPATVGDTGLTEFELATAATLGVSAEAFLKSKKG